MGPYIVKRLLRAVPVVLFSTILVFVVIHVVPGDPAVALAGPNGTPETIAQVRRDLGLDQPLPVQYIIWIGRVLRGDLGVSVVSGQPVAGLLALRAPATVELAVTAMVISICIALPVGIVSALHPRGKVEWLISTLQSLWLALPPFWSGILAIILFAIVLHWLPPGGRVADANNLGDSVKSLILPSVTLALGLAANLSRALKFNLLEVMYEDYVRTARAKGADTARVVFRHVLRNALLPMITILGIQFGTLLGGTIIIETVYSWPGVGGLLLDAINNRDYAVVQSGLLFLVLLFICINLLVDLAYALIDPRVRMGTR